MTVTSVNQQTAIIRLFAMPWTISKNKGLWLVFSSLCTSF